MKLTKTDFIQYLNCPKSLWLLKHDPDKYPHGKFSLFMQKIVREGYQVEKFVQEYFDEKKRSVSFQRVFETDDGLYARADAIEQTSDGQTFLYEVKSSTSVKTTPINNHLKDACFQKITAERAGQKIDKVFIVHLNGNYSRNGAIEPEKLLKFVDVTNGVADIYSETVDEIDLALALVRQRQIDRGVCPCLNKSRANHCDTFSIFNPNIPKHSIYSLPRLSAKMRADLVARQLFDLRDLPKDCELTSIQRLVAQAAKNGKPQINPTEIKSFLSKFEFPLHFFDYETYASSIPIVDGIGPHRQFPVQYSLHILEQDGSLTHLEFLERHACLPIDLIENMQNDIGSVGSIVSWHASFEKTRNTELAVDFPDKADFLLSLNKRMVDLEDVFKTSYVDVEFDGSTSIKKVLPVVCPNLDYSDLIVQDGSSAMEAWERMIHSDSKESSKIASELLRYCKRDTFAMVEIYRFLSELQ